MITSGRFVHLPLQSLGGAVGGRAGRFEVILHEAHRRGQLLIIDPIPLEATGKILDCFALGFDSLAHQRLPRVRSLDLLAALAGLVDGVDQFALLGVDSHRCLTDGRELSSDLLEDVVLADHPQRAQRRERRRVASIFDCEGVEGAGLESDDLAGLRRHLRERERELEPRNWLRPFRGSLRRLGSHQFVGRSRRGRGSAARGHPPPNVE